MVVLAMSGKDMATQWCWSLGGGYTVFLPIAGESVPQNTLTSEGRQEWPVKSLLPVEKWDAILPLWQRVYSALGQLQAEEDLEGEFACFNVVDEEESDDLVKALADYLREEILQPALDSLV